MGFRLKAFALMRSPGRPDTRDLGSRAFGLCLPPFTRQSVSMDRKAAVLSTALLLPALFACGPALAEVDAEAAQALAKRNDCFKCHAIDKTKKAPAYKRVAARLKTRPDAAEAIVVHVTSGHVVKLDDGTEENHRIIDTRDPGELRNLALWILSL